ncbi:MAG: efflux RND transporter periplasmic adaptor subunit [Anaerolineae bacterium]
MTSRVRTIVIGILVLAAVAGGYWWYRVGLTRRVGSTVLVRRGTITATVETTGQVRSARQVELSLPFGGRVKRVAVSVGDEVEAGQLLLELEAPDAERRVREAELNLETRQLQLDKVRAGASPEEIEIAQANLRKAALAKQVAQAAYDEIADEENAEASPEALALQQATIDYQIAQRNYERLVNGPPTDELAALEKQLESAQLALERAQAQLKEMRLSTPWAGTVVRVEANEGEMVSAYRPVVVIADLPSLQIIAEVDEIDVAEVAPGQEVEIRLDAYPGQTLPGTIVSLAPAASPQRGSTVYEAVVEFNAEGLALRLGMGANLKIITLEKEGVLLVPNRAIQPIGRRKLVKVLDGRNIWEVKVVTGLSNESETEIIEGLAEGQKILIE